MMSSRTLSRCDPARDGPNVSMGATSTHLAAAPVRTHACCTGPPGARFNVASLTSTEANRWSGDGEPTIYLAGDPGVALAELGRHWGEQQAEAAIWSVTLSLEAAADLRDPTVRSILGVPDEPTWILDMERCHALASGLRSDGMHDGLIVPSVAFLDDPSRWNAVVFVDRQARALDAVLRVESAVVRLVQPEDGVRPASEAASAIDW